MKSQASMDRLEELSRHWGWFLTLGLLLIVLGLVAMGYAVWSTMVVVAMLGGLVFAGGILQCVLAIRAPYWSGFFLNLVAGLLYLVVGYLFMSSPAVSALSLTLLMAAFFLVGGLFRIFAAIINRFHHWGWMLANGIVTLLLGVLLLAQWPISGLWAIGLFVGIELLITGSFWTGLSFSLRHYGSFGQHGGQPGGLAHP